MCPVCIASAGLTIGNVISGGGVAALAAKILRRKKNSPAIRGKKDSIRRNGYVDSISEAGVSESRVSRGVAESTEGILG
jgi:hypothetical protein